MPFTLVPTPSHISGSGHIDSQKTSLWDVFGEAALPAEPAASPSEQAETTFVRQAAASDLSLLEDDAKPLAVAATPVATPARASVVSKAPAVETSEAPAVETSEAPAVETSEDQAVETSEAPAVETSEPEAVEASKALAIETVEDLTATPSKGPTPVEDEVEAPSKNPRIAQP